MPNRTTEGDKQKTSDVSENIYLFYMDFFL